MFQVDNCTLNYDSLIDTIRSQRWFAQRNSSIQHINIDDWLVLQSGQNSSLNKPSLMWMKISVQTNDQVVTYSAILQQDGSVFNDASSSTEFIQAVKLAGPEGLTTSEGASISLLGEICYEVFTSMSSLDEGSSNTLQRCSTLNNECVIKLYRTLTPVNKTEQRVLHRLNTQSVTPRLLGHISYQLNSEQPECLGIITEFLAGEPIHRIFSRDIKAKIAEFGAGNEINFNDVSTGLKQVCRAIGDNVFSFHANLQTAFNQNKGAFNYQGFLDTHLEIAERVLKHLAQDHMISEENRRQFEANLHYCINTLLIDLPSFKLAGIPTSIAHGDLHLAHVFIALDTMKCRIIDPSPISINNTHEDYSSQLCLSDLVSLQRGLEYFSFDEVMDAIPVDIKSNTLDIVNELMAFFDSEDFKEHGLSTLLNSYSSLIFSEIFDAYKGHCQLDALTTLTSLYHLFYFGRLLNELEYNFCYGRQFFKACDLFYLNQLTEDLKKCIS